MLELNGAQLMPAGELFGQNGTGEEDRLVYHMPPEEKLRIEKLIADYDARPPFDRLSCRQQFKDNHGWSCSEQAERLPGELYDQIADIRVFTLGYCTKEILHQLKHQSLANESKMHSVLNEYREAEQAERIPNYIRDKFNFHDCKVTEIQSVKDIIIRLDTQGGFTSLNHITFVAPEVVKLDEQIIGSSWLYNELYRMDEGFEIHVLFAGKGMPELIIRCRDIVVEEK